MYPTGSNGSSQAIVNSRVIRAKILAHAVGPSGVLADEKVLCKIVSDIGLRNRKAGHFGLLDLVDNQCCGVLDNSDEIIPLLERQNFM